MLRARTLMISLVVGLVENLKDAEQDHEFYLVMIALMI